MAPPSTVTVRLHELLADGEWHAREDVVARLVKLVPPGVSWRAAERHRLKERRRKGLPDGTRTHHTERATALATGARHVVGDRIQKQVEMGHLERRRNGEGIELRVRPS